MIVAIVGSRDYPKLTDVDYRVQMLADRTGRRSLVILSGGARGVDRRAIVAAKALGLATEEMPADWNPYGDADYDPSAGYKRNQKMVEVADMVIAFWDGESRGTKHTIDLALKAHKTLEVHFP